MVSKHFNIITQSSLQKSPASWDSIQTCNFKEQSLRKARLLTFQYFLTETQSSLEYFRDILPYNLLHKQTR